MMKRNYRDVPVFVQVVDCGDTPGHLWEQQMIIEKSLSLIIIDSLANDQ